MLGRGHRTSSETSRERAEWVSAPTEMKSTPVSAISRTVSSVTPPEASSGARPADERDGFAQAPASCCRAGSVGAGGERLAHLVERSHSTSIGRPVPPARAARRPAGSPPASREVVVLDRIPSSRPKRWFVPPPQRTAYFSSARSPASSCACRGRRAGALDRVDEAACERRDAGEAAEEVERGPLAGEDRARAGRRARGDSSALLETRRRRLRAARPRRSGRAPEDGGDARRGRRRRPAP